MLIGCTNISKDRAGFAFNVYVYAIHVLNIGTEFGSYIYASEYFRALLNSRWKA